MINEVYMINWDEPEFEKNYDRASSILETDIKIISGIKGIHSAHAACARLSSSEFFWCIDGDNWLYESARHDMDLTEQEITDNNSVYVMRAKNPFNELVYGHGAVKIFPTYAFLKKIDFSSVDMTSGADLHYRIVHRLISEHRYNSSNFHTWRTSFRECVKLSSSIIKNQNQKETDNRLKVWCDQTLLSKSNMAWAKENIDGAIAGNDWGKKYAGSKELSVINDFDRLRDIFESCYR